MTLTEGPEKGHDEGTRVSASKGMKIGIGIAVMLGILYAAVFAVESTKGQNSPAPENLQGVAEADTNSPSPQEDTIAPVPEENTNQPSSGPQLFADISLANNPIERGDVQMVTVTVFDGGYKLYRASVDGTVTYSDGTQKQFSGTTDGSGQFVYSWQIGDATPGTFSVDVDVSSGGTSISKHSSFEVTST